MDTRVQDLELQLIDLQREVNYLRNEVASLGQIASMAHDEAQQVGVRMDQMEQEWMTWSEAQQQSGPQGGNFPLSQCRLHRRHSPHRIIRLEHRRHTFSDLCWSWRTTR